MNDEHIWTNVATVLMMLVQSATAIYAGNQQHYHDWYCTNHNLQVRHHEFVVNGEDMQHSAPEDRTHYNCQEEVGFQVL